MDKLEAKYFLILILLLMITVTVQNFFIYNTGTKLAKI